jgi:hypothetical protein
MKSGNVGMWQGEEYANLTERQQKKYRHIVKRRLALTYFIVSNVFKKTFSMEQSGFIFRFLK